MPRTKRFFDIVLSAVVLTLAAPVIAGLWVCIRLTSPGPGFYKQVRLGLYNEPFFIYKLRTMRHSEQEDLRPCLGKSDPRVTWLGAWLRSLKLDELPQLYNVLCGDMSLVGPRPHNAHDILANQRRNQNYIERTKIRPGLTSPGKALGITDFEYELELDIAYINKPWSLWFDTLVICHTVYTIVRGYSVDEPTSAHHPALSQTEA
jgi:putative colanic acid biosynthesis UDP-glucose lipid carrier transferase